MELLGEGFISLSRAAEVLGTTQRSIFEELSGRGVPVFVQAHEWDGWVLPDIYNLEQERDEAGDLVSVVIDEEPLERHGERRQLSERLAIRFVAEAVAIVNSITPVSVCQFLRWPSREGAFVVPFPGQPEVSEIPCVRRLRDLSTAAGVACDERPTRWASRCRAYYAAAFVKRSA